MRLLRALVGSLLWILSGVVGLVGVLLCVTVILLPLGIPLLGLARRLFRSSMAFFLPRSVRHPAQELGKSTKRGAKDAAGSVREVMPRKARKKTTKAARKTRKKAARRGRKLLGR